jgi:Nuclease-related domain
VFNVSGEAIPSSKTMRLRYTGRCRACGVDLSAGTLAGYDGESKTVSCLACIRDATSGRSESAIEPLPVDDSSEPRVFDGVAGASAQREYERRKRARETRIRDAHPLIGGLILALSDDPQSTKAWATGARGEERLGGQLDTLAGGGVHVLHDRRIPRTRANIDHMVVCPSGVFVIDAKKYQGRPSLRVDGGLFRPRIKKLMIGSRDGTKLVDGVHKQVDLITSALESADLGQIPVSGMLCFVEADWPLIGGDFTIAGLRVLWPKKAASYVRQPGSVDAEIAHRIHRTLAISFPSA